MSLKENRAPALKKLKFPCIMHISIKSSENNKSGKFKVRILCAFRLLTYKKLVLMRYFQSSWKILTFLICVAIQTLFFHKFKEFGNFVCHRKNTWVTNLLLIVLKNELNFSGIAFFNFIILMILPFLLFPT